MTVKAHDVNVGDIFCASWGYNQTNIDFYEVTRLAGKTMVEFRAISKNSAIESNYGWTAGSATPKPGDFYGEVMRRKVDCSGGSPSLRVNSFKYAFLWDGKPRQWTRHA